MEIYRDGVGAVRCAVCSSALRDGADQPVAIMRIDDLEEIACLLVDYVDCPQVWAPVVRRLEQATGRTVAQIKSALQQRTRDALAHRCTDAQ